MGNINARDPYYWNVPDDPGVRNENWMQPLSNNLSISQLSVPGTHNTMARDGNLWVWCQSLSLIVQLLVGIRFLDIRCRHYRNGLPIHHEAFFQKADLSDVLSTTVSFLSTHPSEVIFMRIKEEYDAEGNNRSFYDSVQDAFNRFPRGAFWTKNEIPSLGECRGKIVVLDDFSQGRSGIYWGRGGWVNTEDTFDASKDDKWNKVKAYLDEAVSSSSSAQLYVTFTSFTSGVHAPRELARWMNPMLGEYVHGKKGRYGIIANNYPGPQLITDIIQLNQ